MSGGTFLALLLIVVGITMAVVGVRRRGPAFIAALKK